MNEDLVRRTVKLVVQLGVTVFGLIFGALILTSKQDATLKHTASGWIGFILGYWLK